MAESALLLFYRGLGPDHAGRSFDDILAWDHHRLEMVHDYIQWLFPLPDPSRFNPDAPILTSADALVFQTDPKIQTQVHRALDLMLDFWGFARVGHIIQRGNHFSQNAARWLQPLNHNYLRLTRVLICLRSIGFASEAASLFASLMDIATHEGRDVISPAPYRSGKTQANRMAKARFVPYRDFIEHTPTEMKDRAAQHRATMSRRRSVRHFSTRDVERAVIEDCLHAAHAGPSGANMQPWHFVVVSDPAIKNQIRLGAEKEEREFYGGRAGSQWTEALEPIGTGPVKQYLDDAPYLIVVFQKNYAIGPNNQRQAHYYVPESVGIAVGILIAGLQTAGLATLIHTPRPMGFLRRILKRPANERACMIIVTGYPDQGATVPLLKKKSFSQSVTFF